MTTAILHLWERAADGLYTIRDVPVFFTNGRGGRTVDAAFLRTIVEKTNASARVGGQPKLYIHHPHKKSGPVVGRGWNLRVVGETIVADFTRVRPAVFREIMLGAYPQCSVDLDPKTLDVIEGIALCGSEESYFEMSPIGLEVTPAQKTALEQDVDDDSTFHFSRATAEAAFTKDAPATKPKSAYMIEPEGVLQIQEIVSNLLTPLKEQCAMVTMRLDAIERKKVMEETPAGDAVEDKITPDAPKDEAANEQPKEESPKGDEPKAEEPKGDAPKEDAKFEEPKAEDKPVDKKPEDKKEEAPFQKPTADLAAFEKTVALEAENAALKSKATRDDTIKQCASFIDARMYGNAEAMAYELADKILAMPEASRADAMKIAKSAYERIGAPKDRLPITTGTSTVDADLKAKAGKWWDDAKARSGLHYGNFSRDQFVEYVEKNPDALPFLRA